MWLGIYQESVDEFGVAIHAEREPTRGYAAFNSGDLRASWTEQEDGGMSLQIGGANAAVEEARHLFMTRMKDDVNTPVKGAIMALDTASDSWLFARLQKSMPAYHVAMAFAFVPLRATLRDDGLVQLGFEMVTNIEKSVSWRIVYRALVKQAGAIVCPTEPTGADACAVLARRQGVVDYLMAWGDTFSLADIEELARIGQTEPSVVIASAVGFSGEDRSWLYRIKLSAHAIANQDLFALTYARAKAKHISGLRGRPIGRPLTPEQLIYQEKQIERFAHQLAVLQLCSEFGIGLWSCPMSASHYTLGQRDKVEDEESENWSVATPLRRDGT